MHSGTLELIAGIALIVLSFAWSGWFWLGSQLTEGATLPFTAMSVVGVIPFGLGVYLIWSH